MLLQLVILVLLGRATGVMCNGQPPFRDPRGNQLFCGRGPGSVNCPSGFFCEIDPAGVPAVCCPSSPSVTAMQNASAFGQNISLSASTNSSSTASLSASSSSPPSSVTANVTNFTSLRPLVNNLTASSVPPSSANFTSLRPPVRNLTASSVPPSSVTANVPTNFTSLRPPSNRTASSVPSTANLSATTANLISTIALSLEATAAGSRSKCPSGGPLKNSQGVELFCGRGPNHVDCPPGTSCEVSPSDSSAVCCASSGSTCPPGIPVVNCFAAPCSVSKCPGVADARCDYNYCGGCNALWYSSNGGLLTDIQCRPQQSGSCPPGVPSVECFADPCLVTTCPGVKNATCTANYCGGCNAVWKNSAGTVLTDRQCRTPLPDAKCSAGGLPLTNSQGTELFCGRGINRVQCPPGSLCTIDRLDRWAVCCPSESCPFGVPRVSCFVAPCQVSKCPGVPDAKCVANYCGGCNALWFAANGGLLTDAECRAVESPCPGGIPPVQCFVNPCRVSTCPSVKDAKCVANYCGGCNAVWSAADGTSLTDSQCHADSKCAAGGVIVRNSLSADLFCGRGPNRTDCPPGSLCVVDPADRFAVCCQGPQCPAGVPVVACFVDPCSVATCPQVRDAKCVSNYCGGCNALWFASNGGLLTDRECRLADTTTCPPDKPAVPCFIDPCLLASCPGMPGSRCVSDYCGGCNAQWYGLNGDLLTSKQCELIPGPVRYLTLRTLAPAQAIATWVPPNGTFCGLAYTAELSYDGQAWNPVPLEQPFSVFAKFAVTPRKKFQVRVTPERGPSIVEVFVLPKGKK